MSIRDAVSRSILPIPDANSVGLTTFDAIDLNRFHTTALRSPTRQALLTARNHHSVNMGGICEIASFRIAMAIQ